MRKHSLGTKQRRKALVDGGQSPRKSEVGVKEDTAGSRCPKGNDMVSLHLDKRGGVRYCLRKTWSPLSSANLTGLEK